VYRDGVGAAATSNGADTLGFTRFLGSNLLPRVDPFLSYPHYRRVQAQVAQVLQTGDISGLGRIFRDNDNDNDGDGDNDGAFSSSSWVHAHQQCRYLSGLLLMALFNEVGLLSLLPMEAVQSQLQARASLIEAWIMSDPLSSSSSSSSPTTLSSFLTLPERKCVVFFGLGRFSSSATATTANVGGKDKDKDKGDKCEGNGDGKSNGHDHSHDQLKQKTEKEKHYRYYVLSPRSPPSVLLYIRVMTHLLATALMTPPSHPQHFFHTLIFSPRALLPHTMLSSSPPINTSSSSSSSSSLSSSSYPLPLARSVASAVMMGKRQGDGDGEGEKGGSYFPTMAEDMMKMAQTVLGGRWYSCPNGK
jgi:hypothetical protein